jgi:hypothetical protein
MGGLYYGLGGVKWIHLAQNTDMAGSCEHGNEHSASDKKKQVISYQLSDYSLLKNSPSVWELE